VCVCIYTVIEGRRWVYRQEQINNISCAYVAASVDGS